MSTLGDFDVSQLLLMLHGELRFAFDASQSAEQAAKLRVEQVNVKMGQKGVQAMGTGPENVSVLDPGRYPDEENWEVNVSYRYGDPLPDIPGQSLWVSSPTAGLVLERLKDVSVRHVKGIDRIWAERLGQAKIATVEDLANCEQDVIRQLCQKYRSLQPLEFQTLILLLARDFIPLKYKEFFSWLLPVVLLESNAALKNRFAGKLSEPEISGLKAMAALICTVIDKRLHKEFSLGLLGPRESDRG